MIEEKSKLFWRDRPVLVTGCTGLLGSWLIEELLKYKANVVGLVRDWVPFSRIFSADLYDKIITVRGQIEDYPLLERILNEYAIDTVFHLAAQTIVETANRNPLSTFETNIKGTWNVLEACRHNHKISRILIASSDKAYGASDQLPYTETAPLCGTHPYDVSKSCGDLISNAYFHSYKLPVCITRCGNFFGGGDLNFNRLVPETIRYAFYNQAPVIRSDGNYVRDFFYVKDAALAYIFLAEKMDDKNLWGQAFNFGYGREITVLELVNLTLKLMDKQNLVPVIENRAHNEIKKQYLSTEKSHAQLGWNPRYSLEEALKETIVWYEDFLRKRNA